MKKVKNLSGSPMLSAIRLPDKEQKLVDGWIKELSDAGYAPDDMIEIFRMARIKYENYKNRKNKLPL